MSTGTVKREGTRNEELVTRKMSALQVIGEGKTLDMGTTFYVVPSRTEVGKIYLVFRLKTRLQCTCLAGKHHPETPCVHRAAVRDFLLDRMASAGESETTSSGTNSASRTGHPGDSAPLRRDNRPFSLLKR